MVATAGGTQSGVVSSVEDDLGFGEHSVVFNFGFADNGAVIGEDDELGLAGAEGPEGGLVAEDELAALHDEGELAVDVL